MSSDPASRAKSDHPRVRQSADHSKRTSRHHVTRPARPKPAGIISSSERSAAVYSLSGAVLSVFTATKEVSLYLAVKESQTGRKATHPEIHAAAPPAPHIPPRGAPPMGRPFRCHSTTQSAPGQRFEEVVVVRIPRAGGKQRLSRDRLEMNRCRTTAMIFCLAIFADGEARSCARVRS